MASDGLHCTMGPLRSGVRRGPRGHAGPVDGECAPARGGTHGGTAGRTPCAYNMLHPCHRAQRAPWRLPGAISGCPSRSIISRTGGDFFRPAAPPRSTWPHRPTMTPCVSGWQASAVAFPAQHPRHSETLACSPPRLAKPRAATETASSDALPARYAVRGWAKRAPRSPAEAVAGARPSATCQQARNAGAPARPSLAWHAWPMVLLTWVSRCAPRRPRACDLVAKSDGSSAPRSPVTSPQWGARGGPVASRRVPLKCSV